MQTRPSLARTTGHYHLVYLSVALWTSIYIESIRMKNSGTSLHKESTRDALEDSTQTTIECFLNPFTLAEGVGIGEVVPVSYVKRPGS